MTSSSSSSPPIPSDIIFKILTRTSLKTIDTCKAVNKEWHDMTFESNFMPQFCARSQNISGYFFQSLLFNKYVSEFVAMDGCSGNSTTTPFHLPIDEQVKKPRHYPFNMQIVASTMQGILCCVRMVNRDYNRYHICKPSTNQWVKLRNPRTRYRTDKVALIVLRSNPLHFKIIRLSSPWNIYLHYLKQGLNYYRREVFDSEHWEWRQGNDLLIPSPSFFDKVTPAVHAGGLVYFKLNDCQVMALNYDGEEVFPRFSLPNPGSHEYKYPSLFEYKGKLGFTCLSPKMMKLWVFDIGKQDWELRMEVNIEAVKGMPRLSTTGGFYNADIALMLDRERVIFYKLQDKSFNIVKLKKCWSIGHREIFPFRSDLEPFDLRMPGANTVSSNKHLYRPSLISLFIVFIFLFGIWLFSHA